MNRRDVQHARDLAAEFVKVSDELLALPGMTYDGKTQTYKPSVWTETWVVSGKLTGTHRRKSLDLTRALAHMRRRT